MEVKGEFPREKEITREFNKMWNHLSSKERMEKKTIKFFPEFIDDFDELLSQYAILAAMDSALPHNPDCKGIMRKANGKLKKARNILKG